MNSIGTPRSGGWNPLNSMNAVATPSAAAMSFMDFAGIGATLLGGYLGDKRDQKENRMTRQQQREQMMANRAGQREALAAGMQTDQDNYARQIMRNRAAIAPYAEMYSGPRFTTAQPNAPIYNPLMEQGHIFNTTLSKPIQAPSTMQHPWGGG
jgi:hypothetical protein